MFKILFLNASLVFLISFINVSLGKEKVRLTDISTLTFYNGRYTTGRRTAPVPQMQCVGGSAGCSQFLPSVVQCYSKGHDGVDVQWECKADLDNRVKLGAVEVVCEGYDYPNDPYVLKGSCGLEYQLNSKSGAHTDGQSSDPWRPAKESKFMFSDLIILVIAGVIMYALYKTCLTTPQYSSTNEDYPDGRPGSYGTGTGAYPSAPPPPYSSGRSSQDYYGADCHGSSDNRRQGGSGSRGNFWTGAATGGILGYLFGQRNTGGSYFGGQSRHHGYTSQPSSNWGWGGGSGGGASSSGTSSSTSFGGTRRR